MILNTQVQISAEKFKKNSEVSIHKRTHGKLGRAHPDD